MDHLAFSIIPDETFITKSQDACHMDDAILGHGLTLQGLDRRFNVSGRCTFRSFMTQAKQYPVCP